MADRLPDPGSSSRAAARAAEWFAAWLTRSEASRTAEELESLCQDHPAEAGELRRLHGHWRELRACLQRAGLAADPGSLAERIRQRYGPGVDPAISLHGQGSDQTARADELSQQAGQPGESSRYRIRGEIARGGMGAILEIWDEDLRRTLAMKVILGRSVPEAPGDDTLLDKRLLARFLEEAQVTGQLDHPGIVPVHQLGLDSAGRAYFTMKLVQGRDLQVILELVFRGQDGWNETRALGVILKVCEAMAYAHSKGVVHRDLKPANVMVGSFGEVYVMDWGVARVLGREDSHDLRLCADAHPSLAIASQLPEAPDSPLSTRDGEIVGTPAYMPPEQALGAVEKLSPRSDVYAIGAMLYHLLARRMPFVPDGAKISDQRVLQRVLDGPPAPLHGIRPDVPAELVAICDKAMAREPGQRYRDTLELGEDLRAFLEHRVVKAHATGALVELQKWVERNRGLAGSVAAAFLLLVAGLAASLAFKARSDRNAALARQEAARAEASERLATEKAEDVLRLSAVQDLGELIAEADTLWPAIPANLARYRDWLERARALVAELPRHEAKLLELRARARPWTREEQESRPLFAELENARRHLEFYRLQKTQFEGHGPPVDPTPAEVGLDLEALPGTAEELNVLAWPLIDPEREIWGGEARGLLLARRALGRAAELPSSVQALIRDSLAWALFAAGRFDEAMAEEERALSEAGPENRAELEGFLHDLRREIERHVSPEGAAQLLEHVQELEARVTTLEVELAQRPEWTFQDSQDRWWHDQLDELVSGIRVFADPERGLVGAGVSPGHGWAVGRRVSFAETIAERSLTSTEAAERWALACAAIADPARCPAYEGLRLDPRLGLLPIGRDPDSGLWEFAHLASGEPAQRGEDGRLVLSEESGIVLVLLPGGPFWMGAQKEDPAQPGYDAQAKSDEAPPHEVTLSPFFLSKYELTQGQWLRFTGLNPSNYQGTELAPTLLHPVEQVSWSTCSAVCQRFGLELPSEAQWEYAARGGTESAWWTGDERSSLAGTVNLPDRSAGRAGADWPDILDWPELDDGYAVHAPVNHYRANPFGLSSVHGNVWEWCRDGYDPDFYSQSPELDPVADSAELQDRVSRGGSFRNQAARARAAFRASHAPELAADSIGLRPALRITNHPALPGARVR